jgi:hypothetical protein
MKKYVIAKQTFDIETSKEVATTTTLERDGKSFVRKFWTLFRTPKGTFWVHQIVHTTIHYQDRDEDEQYEDFEEDEVSVLSDADAALTWIEKFRAAVTDAEGLDLPVAA